MPDVEIAKKKISFKGRKLFVKFIIYDRNVAREFYEFLKNKREEGRKGIEPRF